MTGSRVIQVYASLEGVDYLAGTASVTGTANTLRTRFSYSREWSSSSRSYDLGPGCPRSAGGCDVPGLPGFLQDAAPDWWGRMLIRKGWPPESLHKPDELDYLLGVDDWARMGNLRLSLDGGETFLGAHTDIPAVLDLAGLLEASQEAHSQGDSVGLTAIKRLLDVGSSALGGARPKATVEDRGSLWLAKFPSAEDERDVAAWEYFALSMAGELGIEVPEMRLVDVGGLHVLLSRRFDRLGSRRIPCMSGRSLLQAGDAFDADYYDIASCLREVSYRPDEDLRELFRRMAFNVAIHNIDDHLRNIGLLHDARGWRLAPAFDVNPDPYLANNRVTSIYSYVSVGEENGLARFADDFGIGRGWAVEFVERVGEALESYEQPARKAGCPEYEIPRFRNMFEDRARALHNAFS